jgi:hypothetical protein
VTRKQQCIYRLYLAAPPTGSPGGLAAAYRLGLHHPDRLPRYSRASLCFATWLAGRRRAKRAK